MNLLKTRFPTILGLFFLVVTVVGTIFFFQGKSVKTNPEIVPSKIRITNISDNKFSVSWITSVETGGSVEYGEVGEKLTNKASDERDSSGTGKYLTHHVTIEKLQPSTSYAFRILSGDNQTRFDNNGSPYAVSTGPVIGAIPPSKNFYGKVELPSKQAADGAIAYLTIPGGSTASTLVREGGNYAFTLSTLRTSDLASYVKFDPSATISNVTIESGQLQSVSSVTLANSAPVPTITLGQNTDFLSTAQTPSVAQVVEETPSVLIVEPLGSESDVNIVTTETVTILNPRVEGETLTTLRPEFRGTGPVGKMLSLALTGQKAISDTFAVANDGTWSWSPLIDLKVGVQKITISFATTSGTTQRVEREFVISTSAAALDPAFVSSPSASLNPVASSAPIVREAMPATDTAVPVTGVIENTLLTAGAGLVIMVIGATLLLL